IQIGAATRLKTAAENLKITAGATLFTCNPDMYTPQELLHFSELGAARAYNETSTDSGKKSTGAATDTVEPLMVDIDGRSSFLVDSTDVDGTSQSIWFQDSTGAYETFIDNNDITAGQRLTLDIGLIHVAPPV